MLRKKKHHPLLCTPKSHNGKSPLYTLGVRARKKGRQEENNPGLGDDIFTSKSITKLGRKNTMSMVP